MAASVATQTPRDDNWSEGSDESDEDDDKRRRFIIKQNHPGHCRFLGKNNQETRKIVKFLNPDVERLNEGLSRSMWIFRNLATLSLFQ